ncbi:aconitate hydratase AcnA [Alicyclobacillus sp. SO9]|uniref:aconitate hydratase AcnA n=1 Tax=Alicyclobacillus sp. SO9 TaxID=2665646 RepID=UPI0018E8BC67|nr:aconitate hydratase AcnA [Alicyclobacillus sp. SO9]QQE79734.1 aconitate hydratase AcnA [Alicyclobacillus sp. SO9]
MSKQGLKNLDSLLTQWTLETGNVYIIDLNKVANVLKIDLHSIPYSSRILIESLLRNIYLKKYDDSYAPFVTKLATNELTDVPFTPSRIIMQDFTGVPALVDLTAMRDEILERGGDPTKVNPMLRTDVVIDHSIQVDSFGHKDSILFNERMEFKRNYERYQFLKWAESTFQNVKIWPPGSGIIHQLNLEHLSTVIQVDDTSRGAFLYPETVLGTDSHTTMINALGVLGWGVGGIEAEATMLGLPANVRVADVVGVYLDGLLPEQCTSTDLVLYCTQVLRNEDLTGCLLEFIGPGTRELDVTDRATISNMAPEYGATVAYFPVDDFTIRYMCDTNRSSLASLTKRYFTYQGLFRRPDSPLPNYSKIITIDMSRVTLSVSGPYRPEDRFPISKLGQSFRQSVRTQKSKEALIPKQTNSKNLQDGAVVIAAISSCTNTSNPYSMIAAGLLAKNAVQHGLEVPSYVKTSMAPGSRVVTAYLENGGLLGYLEKLGFYIVGYGCTTCSGSSGPLDRDLEKLIKEEGIYTAAVLSGNRNFPARIHPTVQANYLASPPSVVALAIAGTVNIDILKDPLGFNPDNYPVYLEDIWPKRSEITNIIQHHISSQLFETTYKSLETKQDRWNSIFSTKTMLYEWDSNSTYVQRPRLFTGSSVAQTTVQRARILAILGDDITTDHISPAGAILPSSSAGEYLHSMGISRNEYSTFGSRRGAHEVMIRGVFSNSRLLNRTARGREGGFTTHFPSGDLLPIYDAAMRYKEEGVPLVVIAGKRYGSGSSRDWAAKGPALLGVKAIIAESFERIHRSNLVRMGILPLEVIRDDTWDYTDFRGTELISFPTIEGIVSDSLIPIIAEKSDGRIVKLSARVRVESSDEYTYYMNGGILPHCLNVLTET